MAITAAQLRGARAMLSLRQEEVATAAGLSRLAIARFELEATQPREATLTRIHTALEKAGAVFIESEAGVGVMMMTKPVV
jgi:predicted transcriptional regulator